MPLRGGGGGPLMANALLNFHFDFLHPSLIVNFVMKLYGKYEFEVESGSSYFGVEDQGTYEFSFIRYDDCLGFEINQIRFQIFQYSILCPLAYQSYTEISIRKSTAPCTEKYHQVPSVK